VMLHSELDGMYMQYNFVKLVIKQINDKPNDSVCYI
jgi:hypothetical protein